MNQPEIPTYTPGIVLPVGSHQAKILKYLTSGGFAQVYQVEISPYDTHSGSNIACLKRVIVPDKASLNVPRAEVEAMKLLRNNCHVVSYIDSHAAKSQPSPGIPNGSYEVFLLMEYCSGKGLIDFMNTRLQNRLKEYEVLSIMSQVSQGIAAMHALNPPLLHRDIKIENVLISNKNEYKVCDFGSVCGVIRPPTNQNEINFVQHDILKNTTAQYRSPEMIDLYKQLPVDEKSDIWALGVFLYKLCYYTTPFEKEGENAILHGRFQYPAYPQYSDNLKNLIRVMLTVQPSQRPNICQVVEEVSRIQGIPCPLKNFYLERAIKQTISHDDMVKGTGQFPALHLQHSLSSPAIASISDTNISHLNNMRMNLNNAMPSNNIAKHTMNNNPYSIDNMSGHLNIITPAMNPNTATFLTASNNSLNNTAQNLQPNMNIQNSINQMKNFPALSTINKDKLSFDGSKFPEFQRNKTMPEEDSEFLNSSQMKFGRGNISSILDSNPTSLDKIMSNKSQNSLSSKSSKVDLSVFNDSNNPPYINTVLGSDQSAINTDKNNADEEDDDIYTIRKSTAKVKSMNVSSQINMPNQIGNAITETKNSSLSTSDTSSKTSINSLKKSQSMNSHLTNKNNSAIMDRYRNLMDNRDDIPIKKTAEGYGKYTPNDTGDALNNSLKASDSLTNDKKQKEKDNSLLTKSKKKEPPKPPSKPSYLGGKRLTTNK